MVRRMCGDAHAQARFFRVLVGIAFRLEVAEG